MAKLKIAETKNELKKYLILLSILPVVIFTMVGLIFGISNLQNNDIFIVYVALIGFTLPLFISRIYFKSDFFSIRSVFCYLIYFAIYFASFLISRLGIITVGQIYSLLGLVGILFFHYLLYRYIKEFEIDEIDLSITNGILAIASLALFIVVMFFVRHYLELHSTDILVHKTVLNGMLTPTSFNIMPSNYSTTFTDQGYPIIIYHSLLFWILNSFGFTFLKLAYLIDFVFSFLGTLVIFKLVHTATKKNIPAIVAASLTLLTFENLAYTTQFFIPQTFTFILFLIILSSKKLTFKKLLLSIVILVISHFFIGAYLSVVLIAKYLIVDKKLLNSDNQMQFKWPAIITLAFVFMLSFANFSVEKSFQQGMVSWVGMVTNPAFAEKTQNLVNLWGINITFVIAALIVFLVKKKRTNLEVTAFVVACASFGAYYLGPAFASKFLLGIGLCAAIFIVFAIEDLKILGKTTKNILFVLIPISFTFSYAMAYYQPLPFLTQNDGTVSAFVQKDASFMDFWTTTKPSCTLLSDPQTQQEIHTFSNGNTARGYYLTLEARTRIISFMTAPTQPKLERLYSIEEFENYNGPICFAITARLRELVDKNVIWTQNIFNYKIDHDEALNPQDKAVKFLEDSGYGKIYQDTYTAVFLIRN